MTGKFDRLGRPMPKRDAAGRFIPSGKRIPRARQNKGNTKTGRMPLIESHIIMIVDRSGSMGHLQQTVVSGVNDFIGAQRLTDPNANFQLIQFAEPQRRGHSVTPWTKMRDVRDMTIADYSPTGGSTALRDAVGDVLTDTIDFATHRYLCVIFTDGHENDSRKFSHSQIRALIETKQNQGNWTFVYLGANQDAFAVGTSYGIHGGNTQSFQHNPRDTARAFMSASVGTMNYTTDNDSQTKTFFTTDLADLTKKDLKKLVDLSHSVRVWPVTKEVEIQPFVEAQGVVYSPGAAFYQLTKKEDVQPYKQLMVVEKGTKKIFGGQDARDVLGLPAGLVRVTPGNHANFDVFVQSHSVNRKLVRGTKLIYKTS